MDVFGIRRSEGDIVHREMSDEILICIKVDPVIGIRLTHIGHVTLTRIRREEYYRLCGEISHDTVDQELNGGVGEYQEPAVVADGFRVGIVQDAGLVGVTVSGI